MLTPGRVELPCLSVRMLIQTAYGSFEGGRLVSRRMQVVGGPAWPDTDRYDVSAKAVGQAPAAEMLGPMMQGLLEERFELKVHVEARETPVYALTVAKGAPKLKVSTGGSCIPLDLNNREQWSGAGANLCGFPKVGMFPSGMSTLDVSGVTMEEFAGRVPPMWRADRPIVDKTGLKECYDIYLEFQREGLVLRNNGDQPVATAADPTGPSIFTALSEQLGLKLAPDKAPVNVIVVDSVRKPSEN